MEASQLPLPGAFTRFKNSLLALMRRLLLWILSAGPTPQHIAIIMDGNRRFAERHGVDRTVGHIRGYESLMPILKDCFDMRVKFVTLYAFSIDNFKRSSKEVSALMDLMQSKLEGLIEKEGLARQHGLRVNVFGDLSLLPEGVRNAAERAMSVTKGNDSAVLNLCVSYTSTNEIVHSIQSIRNELVYKSGKGCKGAESQSGGERLRNGMIECSLHVPNTTLQNRSSQPKRVSSDTFTATGRQLDVNDFIHGAQKENFSNCKTKQDYRIASLEALNSPIDGLQDRRLAVPETRDSTQVQPLANTTQLKESSQNLSSYEIELPNISACGDYEDSARKLLRSLVDLVCENEIQQHLYAESCPPPDILLRTSGETRLSNFLLWQTSFSHLAFYKVLWPDISFIHMFAVVFEYQRAYTALLTKRHLCNQMLYRRAFKTARNGAHVH